MLKFSHRFNYMYIIYAGVLKTEQITQLDLLSSSLPPFPKQKRSGLLFAQTAGCVQLLPEKIHVWQSYSMETQTSSWPV